MKKSLIRETFKTVGELIASLFVISIGAFIVTGWALLLAEAIKWIAKEMK